MAMITKELIYSKGHKRNIIGKELEYVMPVGEYKSLAAACPKGMNQPDFVLDYLNDTGGFLGTVTKIVTEDIPVYTVHNLEE